jgi:hypothetical protein
VGAENAGLAVSPPNCSVEHPGWHWPRLGTEALESGATAVERRSQQTGRQVWPEILGESSGTSSPSSRLAPNRVLAGDECGFVRLWSIANELASVSNVRLDPCALLTMRVRESLLATGSSDVTRDDRAIGGRATLWDIPRAAKP